MHTPKTIVIIGTGATGKGIAAGLSGSRYRVLLCGHDFLETRSFVEELQAANPFYDIEALSCSYEASWEADIIILAISAPHQPEVAERIKKVASQKVVITISENGSSLQALLPYSKIVEAFSGINAATFNLGSGKKSVRCPVSTGHPEVADDAAAVVTAVGFTPVVKESIRQAGYASPSFS